MTGAEHSLDIYLGKKSIGTLSLEKDKLHLRYRQEWQQQGYALSPHLPLSAEIPVENVERFLRNLLPEGHGLETLLQVFHLSQYNTFGSVRALGADIPGALVILAPNHPIPEKPLFRLITDKEIEQRLQHRDETDLIIWDERPRLSNAGVQDKINVLINEKGKLGFGEGSLCSTHILKFEKNTLTHLVLNEYITMLLAQKCGLTVAQVKLMRYGQYAALLVHRFDRHLISNSHIKRRHIIDGCQALNLPPEYKYERIFGSGRDVSHIREGASYAKLFEFANQCTNPALTKLQILDWALFNILVFNHDAHGKNISFFVGTSGIKLAPFYDLVNIKMYPDFEQHMAMALGDEFDGDNIYAYQLAEFSDCCQLDRTLVSKRLTYIATRLATELANMDEESIKTKEEARYLKTYKSLLLKQCQHLIKQAPQIPSITL